MAEFGGLKLTDAGRVLLAKALAGATLTFTKTAVGDGTLPEGADIYTLTALVSKKRDLEIVRAQPTSAGSMKIDVVMTNQGQAEGMFIRELGLYAQDPQLGEILYAYANAGERPDYLPGQDGPDAVSYVMTFVAVIEQAPHVTAIINDNQVYVTHPELDERLANLFPAAPANGVTAADIEAIWARLNRDSGNIMRPISVQIIKEMILGDGDHNFQYLVDSDKLQVKQNNLFNTYSRDKVYVELFQRGGITYAEHASVAVERSVVGSDCIDVANTSDLVVGREYFIMDSFNWEFIEITEILTNKRFRISGTVTKTYGESAVVCMTNWTFNREGGAVARTNQTYWSEPLELTAIGENKIIILRDTGSGTLKVQRRDGAVWADVTKVSSTTVAVGKRLADRRTEEIYTLPKQLNEHLRLRIRCETGPVSVDWVVVSSIAEVGHKVVEYKTPGTYQWTAPAGVTGVTLTGIAGGNGGGVGAFHRGGNAGEAAVNRVINVTPGTTYTITIGLGGTACKLPGGATYWSWDSDVNPGGPSNVNWTSGTVGGNTSFGTLLTLLGGGGVEGKDGVYYSHSGSSYYSNQRTPGDGAVGAIEGSMAGYTAIGGVTEGGVGARVAGIRGGGGIGGRENSSGTYDYQSGETIRASSFKYSGSDGGNGYLKIEWDQK